MEKFSLDTFWTLCDVAFRWTHVASVAMWSGLIYAAHLLRQRPFDAHRTADLLEHPLARRVLWWLRWSAAIGWSAGMLLLFSHYYHGLLGPLLLDAGLAPETLESLTKENGHPNVRAWLPGFLALVAGYGVYELLFVRARTAMLRAAAVGASLVLWSAIGRSLDVDFHFSSRAAWVHLGAIAGSIAAGNVWFRIWPTMHDWMETHGRERIEKIEREAPDVRARVAHTAYLALAGTMFMLSNHYPLLFAGSPGESRYAAIGVMTTAGAALWFADRIAARR